MSFSTRPPALSGAFTALRRNMRVSNRTSLGIKQRMVGFRNVAIHEYARPNLDIVRTIITKQLDDFRTFSSTIVKTIA
jgi:uncharacterized protein YutE (UPF0331/DUF86 family)